MRIFYRVDTGHLIVTPLRNGSTYLQENMSKYKLTEVTHGKIFTSILDDVEKKTFIYRDPCLRLLSFYNKFVYEPYKKNINTVGIVKSKLDNEYDPKLFVPLVRGNDLLSDIISAKTNIIKNYKDDLHTTPQINYFKDFYDQRLDDYEIISINQYPKWFFLTFADKTVKSIPSAIDQINLTPSGFLNMQKIQRLCSDLYKDDYRLLESNITYL